MIKKLNHYICTITLVILTSISCSDSQILYDSVATKIIKSGVSRMYNLELSKANEIFTEVEKLYPGHPVNYLLSGIYTYWENYPLLPTSAARDRFEKDLRKCIDLSSQKPYSEDFEAESLLTNICARGLLLLFYNDNDLSIKVIPLATGSYKYLMRSFDFVSLFPDFYYFTGIYNYYREAYPKLNPVYKPLASMFPPGDIIKGLNELVRSGENSIFLRAESYSILTYINMGFENNYPQALKYSQILTDMYPDNLYFRAMHIRNLLIIKEYDQAENLIKSSLKSSGNTFYDAQVMVFNGILQEKKYQNFTLAKQLYEDGINSITFSGDYGNEFCGYAYLGLSRICEYYGDRAGKKAYQRKGLDLVDFKKVNFD